MGIGFSPVSRLFLTRTMFGRKYVTQAGRNDGVAQVETVGPVAPTDVLRCCDTLESQTGHKFVANENVPGVAKEG